MKSKNEIFLVILFIFISLVKPIPYESVKRNTPINNEELNFFEKKNPEVVLVKNENFFVEGFIPVTTPGPAASRPFNVPGRSPRLFDSAVNPSTVANPSPVVDLSVNPKIVPKIIDFTAKPKQEKETAQEKAARELRESILEEEKLNRTRREGDYVFLIIRDGQRIFIPEDQLLIKYHHALKLGCELT